MAAITITGVVRVHSIALSNNVVDEDAAPSTVVGDPSISNPPDGPWSENPITYSLADDAEGLFDVEDNKPVVSGSLIGKSAQPITLQADNSFDDAITTLHLIYVKPVTPTVALHPDDDEGDNTTSSEEPTLLITDCYPSIGDTYYLYFDDAEVDSVEITLDNVGLPITFENATLPIGTTTVEVASERDGVLGDRSTPVDITRVSP